MKYTSSGGGEGEKQGAKHATGLWIHHHSASQCSVYLDVSPMCVFVSYVKVCIGVCTSLISVSFCVM